MTSSSSISHDCFVLFVVAVDGDDVDEEKEDCSPVCSNVTLLLSAAATVATAS